MSSPNFWRKRFFASPSSVPTGRFTLLLWIGDTSASYWRRPPNHTASLKTFVSGQRLTPAWAVFTDRSMSWCLFSRKALRHMSIMSSWGALVVIAQTSGITQGRTPLAATVMPNLPCTRRSNPWRWLPTRFWIAQSAGESFSTPSPAAVRP